MIDDSYTFEYRPGTIHHGANSVANLAAELDEQDLSRALVVTGSTVSSVPEVMEPIENGLGDTLVSVFGEVGPEKHLKTAYEGARIVREKSIDALVGVGGGSSLDMAKLISTLAGHDRPLDDVTDDIIAREAMLLPDDGPSPAIFAVPTTLAGADFSQVAGVKLSMNPGHTHTSEIPSGGVSHPDLLPTAVFYDTSLFATTPDRILASSAMNGFDKGIEMLYTRHRTPITDATAMRGVRLLQDGLPALTDDETPEEDLSQVLQGIALVQYGLSTPNQYRASIIHAFGHALSRNYEIQQGSAHAIAAPHVLRYLFDRVDGRRDLLAEALAVDNGNDESTPEAIVTAVEGTRDALELPSRLRSVEGADRDHVPDLARAVIEDSFMAAAPVELKPTQEGIEAVFEEMW